MPCLHFQVRQLTAHQSQLVDRQDRKNPATMLQSSTVSNYLATHIVAPVLQRVQKSCAFRLVIMRRDLTEQDLWQHTEWGRRVVDEAIKKLPGVDFFASALTATVSVHRGSRIIYPALGFWVIGDQLQESVVLSSLRQNPLGARLKLFTQRTNTKFNADRELYLLSMVVKDCTGGFVQKKIEMHCPGTSSLVTFYVGDDSYREQLVSARQLLPNLCFHASFEDY